MKKKVLVIDDSKEDLALMKELLEQAGFIPEIAADGSEALNKLSEGNSYALILVDILLPVISGYELLKLLREKINHDAKMIYVSIVPEKEIYYDDVDGFIQKPFSPEKFISTVKKVVGEQKNG